MAWTKQSGCTKLLLLDLAGRQEKLQPVGVRELLLQRLNVFFADVLIETSERESANSTKENDEMKSANLWQALNALFVFHFLLGSQPVALHHGSGSLVRRRHFAEIKNGIGGAL